MPISLRHINPEHSVNEILRRHPSALPILAAAGIDSGGEPLATAAHTAGLALEPLLLSIAYAEELVRRPAGGDAS